MFNKFNLNKKSKKDQVRGDRIIGCSMPPYTVSVSVKNRSMEKASSVFGFAVISLFFLIIFASWLQSVEHGNAQVVSFFPTSCLGGWKNTEKASGVPDVTDEGVKKYNNKNSASISDTVAQIFCGGFKGEIPTDALPKKIVLKFSWAFKDRDSKLPTISTEKESKKEVEEESSTDKLPLTEKLPLEESVIVPETTSEASPEAVSTEKEEVSEEKNQEESFKEQSSEPFFVEEQSLIRRLIPKVYAQEQEIDTTSPIPSSSLLEVLYTLDGDKWQSLGYVSDVNNDVSFEMPMDIFTSVADLERVQIAVHTVSTFDSVPTIYLDSLWLEVEYTNPEETKEDRTDMLAAVGESLERGLQETLAVFSPSYSYSRTPSAFNVTSPINIEFSADDISDICGSAPDFPPAEHWWIFVNSLKENGGDCGGGSFCSQTFDADDLSVSARISLPVRSDYYVAGIFCSDNTDDPNDPNGNFWSPITTPALEGDYEAPFDPIFDVQEAE